MEHGTLRNARVKNPAKVGTPALSWGKVVKRNPDNTVDIAMQNGGTFQHVQLASSLVGSQVGSVYLPTHDLTNPVNDPNGTWDLPTASGKGDLFAIVGFLGGSSRQPKVLGFFNPEQTEMNFKTLGLKVDRHESGIYHITLPEGHDEIHYPDGSYIVVGNTASHDMTSENPAWSPPTQMTPMPMVIHHSSGLMIEIDSTGKFSVSNLAIGSGSHPVALADLLTTWLNNHTHTSAASGSPTSVPITPVSGISSTKLTTD